MSADTHPTQLVDSFARLNRWIACALAASIPNDALLALVPGDIGRSPSYYIGYVAALASLPLLPRIVRVAVPSLPWVLLTTAAAVPVLLWVVGGAAAPDTYDRAFKFSYMAALFLWVGRDPVWRRRLVESYLVGWGLFLIVALYTVASGRAEVAVHYEVTRRAVLGMNENYQSALASSGLVLLIPMACRSPGKVRSVLIVTGLALGSAVFVLGASRSASAALAAGILFTIVGLLRCRELRFPLRTIAVACAVAAVLLVTVSGPHSSSVSSSAYDDVTESVQSLGTRIERAFSGEDLGRRDETSAKTWNVFLKHPLGVGYGGTNKYIGGDPHNSYLKIAAEGGFAAALFLVAGLVLVARNVLRGLRHADLVGPVAGFVLFSVVALVGQAILELPYWFFLSFVALPPRNADASAYGRVVGAPAPGVAGSVQDAEPFCADAPR